MKLILSKKESQSLDKLSNSKKYISSDKLMNNAGKLSAQYFVENIQNPFNKKVLVIAGNGNNGSDAFIMHYYLKKYGVNSKIFFFNRDNHKKLFNKYYLSDYCEIDSVNTLTIESFDWFVDGIFGVGLNRPIQGKFRDIILLLAGKMVFSLDIPSGICSNSGQPFSDIYCKPTFVVGMGYFKPGNIMNSGKEFFRNTHILDIDFPQAEDVIKVEKKFLVEKSDIKALIKKEDLLMNKYNSFCSLIVGSKKYSGAGILAMLATVKSASSYVQTLVPGSISDLYRDKCAESKIVEIGQKDFFSSDSYDNAIMNLSSRKSPVLIGPGLGERKATKNFTIKILNYLKKEKYKCVIDASAFEPLYSKEIKIKDLPDNCIITPHRGEFDKIFPKYYRSVKSELEICSDIAKELDGRVLILKGPTTIIVSSDKKIFLINNSNSLLATAGSGDILSGIITGLLSRGYSLDEASLIGVYIQGLCSEIFYLEKSKYNMTSIDILNLIQCAFNEILL